MRKRIGVLCGIFIFMMACTSHKKNAVEGKKNFSGIYPHLAYYNNEGECGTGAVVPWAGRLWVITYGPHLPKGSSDKLYEITSDLQQIVREESIGGTPANRMIHQESQQLFIGPYAIDSSRNVRVIPYSEMFGRHTGNARHLTDPAGKIYYGTMEAGFYEVDVKTLKPTMLYEDANARQEHGKDLSTHRTFKLLPGAHGKGVYSGQGVMVFSNNGEPSPDALWKFDLEAGVLAEWNGKDWKVVRRSQFVEVTGPGGIYGNPNPETDPIWATGWDHKSVLVGVRDNSKWSFYRLPKASHTYDGAHGWNTEWPRIRNVGTDKQPDYLMTMHGMFWRFPGSFSSDNSAGIRPRSAYLKVIGDFTRWNNQLVFGCDDAARIEFLNIRKAKGNIGGPGQSNSNLWFTSDTEPDNLGPNTAEGAVWLSENIKKSQPSEPFLFAGWNKRVAWVKNEGSQKVKFAFEIDEKGNGNWKKSEEVSVEANASAMVDFPANITGEWIRVSSDQSTKATVHFSYTDEDSRSNNTDPIFKGLSKVQNENVSGGLLFALGNDRRALGILATEFSKGQSNEVGYYELDGEMNLVRKEDTATANYIRGKFKIPQHIVSIDKSSVLMIDDRGRRWRLPLGDDEYKGLTETGSLRICREVSTERDLFSCHGTFYELPAENADGFAKIRPVSSHHLRIHDYASYRGLLVLTGIDKNPSKQNNHIITSADGKASVWVGTIDDLWKLGKPVGKGGPWKNENVKANMASDPYLIGFYDQKELTLSHNATKPVTFTIEVEPVGHGPWMVYKTVTVAPGEKFSYKFPGSFQSRWIRFKSDLDCEATAWLEYR